jgi:hypothetical protein
MNMLVPATARESEYLLPTSELIFKFTKVVANDGEKIAYRLSEQTVLQEEINFNTVFFDDYIQLAVYHKNSTANAYLIGREKLHIR